MSVEQKIRQSANNVSMLVSQLDTSDLTCREQQLQGHMTTNN